jgi:MFS superfamily sulfate permease-like transporter
VRPRGPSLHHRRRFIDFRGLAEIRRESHGEFLLALETAAAVLELGVEQGIPFAIARSVIRYVRHNYEPRTAVLTPKAEEAGSRGRRSREQRRNRSSSSIGSLGPFLR